MCTIELIYALNLALSFSFSSIHVVHPISRVFIAIVFQHKCVISCDSITTVISIYCAPYLVCSLCVTAQCMVTDYVLFVCDLLMYEC